MRNLIIKSLAALLLCAAAAHAASAKGQKDTLYISELYTTFVIFSTDISNADLSNRQIIIAAKPDNQGNAVGLRAKAPFTTTASLTVFESNGRAHVFILAYGQHPDELLIDTRVEQSSDGSGAVAGAAVAGVAAGTAVAASSQKGEKNRVMLQNEGRSGSSSQTKYTNAPELQAIYAKPRELYHLGCKQYDVILRCTNIYSYSDITYLTLTLENRSNISYEATTANFAVTSKSKGERSVDYNNILVPKNSFGSLLAEPGHTAKICFSLDKITLARDQVLSISLHENKGERNFILTLDYKDVNNAVLPL